MEDNQEGPERLGGGEGCVVCRVTRRGAEEWHKLQQNYPLTTQFIERCCEQIKVLAKSVVLYVIKTWSVIKTAYTSIKPDIVCYLYFSVVLLFGVFAVINLHTSWFGPLYLSVYVIANGGLYFLVCWLGRAYFYRQQLDHSNEDLISEDIKGTERHDVEGCELRDTKPDLLKYIIEYILLITASLTILSFVYLCFVPPMGYRLPDWLFYPTSLVIEVLFLITSFLVYCMWRWPNSQNTQQLRQENDEVVVEKPPEYESLCPQPPAMAPAPPPYAEVLLAISMEGPNRNETCINIRQREEPSVFSIAHNLRPQPPRLNLGALSRSKSMGDLYGNNGQLYLA